MQSSELETGNEIFDTCEAWRQFLEHARTKCSAAAFENWLAPIVVVSFDEMNITLEILNVFVKEYLLSNFIDDLRRFLPVTSSGEPAILFQVAKRTKKPTLPVDRPIAPTQPSNEQKLQLRLNPNYRFETYIEGPSNQFVKSAALGVAMRPGQSYNPLFIHGGVGLGKTHLLHSIAHTIQDENPHLRIQCVTTEAFINDLVEHLRNKSIDRMKRFYRSDIDVLLIDDIQFL
ncbi:MAG: chromosomal replication initiator protein DnaA, partial [Chlamydiia bacterium]|nr:chromosomal replication initiator protein DnaA [Chlamydiia bacterium]